MSRIRITALLVILSLFNASSIYSQNVPFNSPRWEISAAESVVEMFNGRECLKLKGGIAYINDLEVSDCIIEYDFLTTGVRGFMGAIWNLQNRTNYEEFYVRPHQLGKPDACQYTPVFNGVAGWQLYHGQGYGTAIVYPFNEWVHVKLVISGKSAEVYINDLNKPALYIPELKRDELQGKVGVEANNASYAWFSNFSVVEVEGLKLQSSAKPSKAAAKGTIMSWMVSNPVNFNTISTKVFLTANDLSDYKWKMLESEPTGITNLAKISIFGRTANTVFAKITITSDKEQIKKLTFGYSDVAMVFLNRNLLYHGNRNYASRDYRYLGTIGLFDELILQLREGENRLMIAVKENFGGWGIIAQIENQEGITVTLK